MLLYMMMALCVLLSIVSLGLYKAFKRTMYGHTTDRINWERNVKEAQDQCDYATQALKSFVAASRTSLFAMADEVERATGHSDEARSLENLAHDVQHSQNPFNVVTQSTLEQLKNKGVVVPPYPLHLGQALELAVALDHKARFSERELYKITRLCRINEYSCEQARWLAETMGIMQRLCANDATEAKRKLRALLDVWETTTELSSVEYAFIRSSSNGNDLNNVLN